MSAALAELVAVMQRLAPTAYAEEWDNVGLIAGDPSQPVLRVMLAIDYTPAVAAETLKEKCDAVIAYHPPIFKPIAQLTSPHVVFQAIRDGIAIYSPHTALDVAEGGTNDCLADCVGLGERSPIRPVLAGEQLKLITFVPAAQVEAVLEALFAAGAGRIGDYSRCSFQSPGMGTFLGEAGTNPAICQSGKFELAAEIRLETVVPIGKLGAIAEALRKSHPYEEPAFDLVKLAAVPSTLGMGRIGSLEAPIDRAALVERIKKAIGISHVLVAGPTSGTVSKIAVCAGSCGSVLEAAIQQGAKVFVTGEIRHHDALKAQSAGITVICTLHSNSERLALAKLRDKLSAEIPAVSFLLSQADRDPLIVV